MSYRKLEVWELEKDVSIALHPMTVDLLPESEMYEEGSHSAGHPGQSGQPSSKAMVAVLTTRTSM